MGTPGWPPASPTSSGGHGKAQTPPQHLRACVTDCLNPRVSRSPRSLPCYITRAATPMSPHPSTLIPLRSQSLATHIGWHPSGAPHRRVPARPGRARAPEPHARLPRPPQPPEHPSPGGAAVPVRDALRSALPAPLCPPARRAGSCSPARHPRAPASGKTPLCPQKTAAGMLKGCSSSCRPRLLLKSSLSSGCAAHPAPLGGTAPPNLGIQGGCRIFLRCWE